MGQPAIRKDRRLFCDEPTAAADCAPKAEEKCNGCVQTCVECRELFTLAKKSERRTIFY